MAAEAADLRRRDLGVRMPRGGTRQVTQWVLGQDPATFVVTGGVQGRDRGVVGVVPGAGGQRGRSD